MPPSGVRHRTAAQSTERRDAVIAGNEVIVVCAQGR